MPATVCTGLYPAVLASLMFAVTDKPAVAFKGLVAHATRLNYYFRLSAIDSFINTFITFAEAYSRNKMLREI
jgi:hypothetical protein